MAKVTITFDIQETGKYLVVSNDVVWKGLCVSATLFNGKKKKKVSSKSIDMNPGINTLEMELEMVKTWLKGELYMLPRRLFSGTLITSCAIEEGITEIEAEVFADCSNLVSVSLPSTLNSIGSGCFNGCRKLEHVELPRSLKAAPKLLSAGYSTPCTFEHTKLVWPEGMTELPNEIFNSYNNPEAEIEIPVGITILREGDFRHVRIKGIHFPASLKVIEPNTFKDAIIEHLEWPDGVPVTEQSQTSLNGGFAQLNYIPLSEVPEALIINKEYNCDTLIVPANVKNIIFDDYGFPEHLHHIYVDPANTVYDSRNNCNAVIETATGRMVLAGALTTVPEGVKEIASTAEGIVKAGVCPLMPSTLQKVSCDFRHFKEITMTPVLMKAMEKLARFNGKLILDSTITELKDAVKEIKKTEDTYGTYYHDDFHGKFFEDCKFTELVLPEGLESVGDYTFYGCSLASDLILPKSLRHIGIRAFALNGIDAKREDAQGPFNLQIPNGVQTIEPWAFAGMRNFRVHIPDSVTDIGVSAFSNWIPANVTLPQHLEVLNDLFCPREDGASKHSSLIIPASVNEVIGNHGIYDSFSECDSVTFLSTTAPKASCEGIDCLANGTLFYPKGADYSEWKALFKGWKFKEI